MDWMKLTRRANTLLASVALATLAACGGGGGSDGDSNANGASAAGIDKYVGSWQSNCISETVSTEQGPVTASARLFVTNTKVSDTVLSVVTGSKGYLGSTCSGTAYYSDDALSTETATLTGTGTVGGQSVDKFSYAGTDGNYLNIAQLSGGKLYLGSDEDLDASGYPTALDTSFYLTKR